MRNTVFSGRRSRTEAANASRIALTPSSVCELASSRGCSFTSLETSQGVTRIMIQNVINRPPINSNGAGPATPAKGRATSPNNPRPPNNPAPDNFKNDRLSMAT